MTIQSLKRELSELREVVKPKVPNVAVLLYNRKARNVVKFNGVDVDGCTREEINKKLQNFSIVLHLPVKDPYP